MRAVMLAVGMLGGCTLLGGTLGGVRAWSLNNDLPPDVEGDTAPFWCGAGGDCAATPRLCGAIERDCAAVDEAWCAARRSTDGESRFACRSTQVACDALPARSEPCTPRRLAAPDPKEPYSVARSAGIGALIGLAIDFVVVAIACKSGCGPN